MCATPQDQLPAGGIVFAMGPGMKAALLSLMALSLGCQTYSVRRSALVPNAAAPARSGEPARGVMELGLSTPRAVSLASPKEGDGANAGLYLPRTQVTGELRIPARGLSPDLDLGAIYDLGLRNGATAITPDQPKPDRGDVMGLGASIFYAPEVSPGFRLGVGAALLLYTIPYIEYRTCIDNCAGLEFTDIEKGSSTISSYRVSLHPSYRVGNVRYFGSITARNHPTNTKGEITNDPFFDSDDEVRSGPTNIIVAAGIEVDFGKLRGLVQVIQPLTQDPVDYAPTVGLGLALPLGVRSSHGGTATGGAPPPPGYGGPGQP